MRYQFDQAVCIRPKGQPAKTFPLGIHEVPEEYEKDPYFVKLYGGGLVSDVESSKKKDTPRLNHKELSDRNIERHREARERNAAREAEKAGSSEEDLDFKAEPEKKKKKG